MRIYLVLSAPVDYSGPMQDLWFDRKVFGPYDEVVVSEGRTIFGCRGKQTPDQADNFHLNAGAGTVYWDGRQYRCFELISEEHMPEVVAEEYSAEKAVPVMAGALPVLGEQGPT